MARVLSLSGQDLGLDRQSIGRGLAYGGGAAAVVVTVIVAVVVLPATREFFLNDAYSSTRTALLAALVIIPVTTVLPEEFLFRGVLHGSPERFAMKPPSSGDPSCPVCGMWHLH